MSHQSIEEMFASEESARHEMAPETRSRMLEAQKVLRARLAADPELVNAIRTYAGFFRGGPADRLLNNKAVVESTALASRLQGLARGVEILASEITDPVELNTMGQWLTNHTGDND